MKQRGTAQSRYARLLLEQGVSYDEILKDSAMQGFNPATLRTIAKRVREGKERSETRKKGNETPNETQRNAMESAHTETAKNAIQDAKNPVSHRFTVVSFFKEFLQTFHPADLIFYACVLIGCLGVSSALPGIGRAVAAVWFFTAAVFLHRLKMYRNWYDAAVLAVLEIAIGVPAHIAWANETLWYNVTALPIDIKLTYGGKMWVGEGVEMPFYIACYVAAVLVFLGGAAILAGVFANKEKG